MGDLIALNGPWQAITFLNFFKAEYYEREEPNSTVVFYEINDELKEVCRLLLSQYDFINHIIDIKDIDPISFYDRKSSNRYLLAGAHVKTERYSFS